MSRRFTNFIFSCFFLTANLVVFGQEDVHELDTVVTTNKAIEPFSWEEEWLIWCESQTCVSSDTGLWNIMGEPDLELDTAAMKSRMAILDMSSELDLQWNIVSHNRVALYVSKRKRGLSTMLGRAPAFFPLFEEMLDRSGPSFGAEVFAHRRKRFKSRGEISSGRARLVAIHVLYSQS